MRGVVALVLLVLLVGLGFGVWFLTGRNPEHLGDAAPAAVAARATDELGVEPAAAIATRAQEATPDRQSVEVLPDGPSAVLRVVRFGSGVPIPQAVVRYARPDFDARKLSPELTDELSRRSGDREAMLERFGATAITDDQGRCRVPLGKGGAQVCARDGEFYGETYVRADVTEEQVLALRVDSALRGVVVDASGQPAAGVRVELRVPSGEKDPMNWRLGDTDRAGRFERPHLQTLAGELESRQLEVIALVPGAHSAVVAVDVCAPPREVMLHLPPTGTVTVSVKDHAGTPLDPSYFATANVQLAAFERRPKGREELDALNRQQWNASIAANGAAVFPHVALDRFLVAKLDFLSRKGFEGPTAVQRHVEVTLEESGDDVILTAILRLPDRSLFAERPIRVTAREATSFAECEVRTDRNGRLRCNVGSGPAGKSAVLSFRSPPFAPGEPHSLELPSQPLHVGVNELGELDLAPSQILIAGRVLPDAGVQVRRVQLEFKRRIDQSWLQEHNLFPEWQPDGSFAVRSGVPIGSPMRVGVQAGPYLPVEEIEFSAGDTGIEIPLRAAGEAIATFLVDESTPLERLAFQFRSMDPSQQPDPRAQWVEHMNHGLSADAQGRGRKEWKGLVPGSYRLTVSCVGVEEPIAAIDAIRVGPGPCDDPRLVDIDLRGRTRGFEIRAAGPSGDPIVDVNAFVVIRSQSDRWHGLHLGKGVAKLAAPRAVDLFILAPGYETTVVESVAESRTIALRPAIETRIHVELPAPLPGEVELRLQLTPSLDLPKRARMIPDTGRISGLGDLFVEESTVGTDGIAVAPARWPGEQTVSMTLSVPGGRRILFADIEPRVITLPAPGGVTMRVGAEGLEGALERLRR